MKALVLAVLLAATPAAADTRRCNVTIVRAPDDVGAVVEQWVRAEKTCNVTLSIRIVPTTSGYHLHARDVLGRVRQRVVPDAQTAGVLVASWVANDSSVDPFTVRNPNPSDEVDPPSTVMPVPAATQHERKPDEARYLAAGLLASTRFGARVEVDLFRWHKWSAGLASSLTMGTSEFNSTWEAGYVSAWHWRVLATVARTFTFNWFELRPSIGAGIMLAAASVDQSAPVRDTYRVVTTEATGQAALIAGIKLSNNWALQAGPIATLRVPQGENQMTNGIDPDDLQKLEPVVMLYGGLQWRVW